MWVNLWDYVQNLGLIEKGIMNLLITGAWQGAKEYIAEIEKLGHKVLFLQQEKDELPIGEEWVEGVICNGLFFIIRLNAL